MMYADMSTFNFASWLSSQKDASDLSWASIGKRLGEAIGRPEAFAPGYVNDMAKGRKPPAPDTVLAAARVFRVDPTWLQAQVDLEQMGEERVLALARLAA